MGVYIPFRKFSILSLKNGEFKKGDLIGLGEFFLPNFVVIHVREVLEDCSNYVILTPLVRISKEEPVLHQDDFALERLAGDIDRSVEEIQQELILLVNFRDLLLNIDPGKLH